MCGENCGVSWEKGRAGVGWAVPTKCTRGAVGGAHPTRGGSALLCATAERIASLRRLLHRAEAVVQQQSFNLCRGAAQVEQRLEIGLVRLKVRALGIEQIEKGKLAGPVSFADKLQRPLGGRQDLF